MKHFLNIWFFIISLIQDQRGEVGDKDADDSAPDDDNGGDDGTGDDDDDTDDIVIEPEDDKSDDDGDKLTPEQVKELQVEIADFKKGKEDLEKEVQTLRDKKTELNTALHQARQAKKTDKADDADSVLTESQLKQILEDNPDDTDAQFKVLKYLSQQVAKGVSADSINAAEVAKNKQHFETFLTGRYPDINVPDSAIRKEVDQTKTFLDLNDHPYGDYFAVACSVLDQLPEILKDAYEDGKKGKARLDTEDARTESINKGKLPVSKKGQSSDSPGLTKEQAETFKQMGLSKSQIAIAQKLVGKKQVKTVSVGV